MDGVGRIPAWRGDVSERNVKADVCVPPRSAARVVDLLILRRIEAAPTSRRSGEQGCGLSCLGRGERASRGGRGQRRDEVVDRPPPERFEAEEGLGRTGPDASLRLPGQRSRTSWLSVISSASATRAAVTMLTA
jgi:hypothetical protein